jgi:tetratricopeptide (TPR) repeat protein
MSASTIEASIDQQWDYSDPAASEARLRALLAEAQRGSPDVAELLTQIARAQGLQGAFDQAHQTLDIVQQLAGLPERVNIRYLLERGRALNSAGRAAEARPLFQAAWERARDAGADFYAIDALHMLAIVADPAAQLGWNRQALALTERTADPRAQRWRGSLYNNIGWAHHDQGDYQAALDMFTRALAWREQQGESSETRIARWCVGRVLRSLGRSEEALALQRALAASLEQAGEEDGYVQEELGELLLLGGQPEAARPHLARAAELLGQDAWLAQHEPERLARLRALAV